MNIEIDKAIIHSVSSLYDEALLSPYALALTEMTQLYVCRMAQRALESDEIKTAELTQGSAVYSMLQSIDELFIEKTQALASTWQIVLAENPDVAASDLLFVLLHVEGTPVFGAMKLLRKSGVLHVTNNGESRLEQIEGVLPPSAGKPDEAFFVWLNDKALKITEKRFEIDGKKTTYLSSRILDCKIGHSPKQALSAICEAAVQVNAQFYNSLGVDEPTVCAAVVEEYREAPKELSAQRVCERLYNGLPHAKEAFERALKEHDIPFETPVEISAPAVRRLEKQSLRSGSGVEVKVPVSVYKNPDAVEFLKNDDGTTSLLIKNILI